MVPSSPRVALVRAGDGWVGVKSSPRQHTYAEISECFCGNSGFPRATFSLTPVLLLRPEYRHLLPRAGCVIPPR